MLETTGCSDIMLAPQFDVRQKLLQMEAFSRGSAGVQDAFRTLNVQKVNDAERATEDRSTGSERSERARSVLELRGMGWNKQEIVEKLWACKKGGSPAWHEGSAAYDEMILSSKIGA